MLDFFTLETKASVLCSLNGNKIHYNFKADGMTQKINNLRRKIEQELILRNYNVPGIIVDFYLDINPDREKQYQYRVSSIKCDDPDVIIQGDYEISVRGTVMSLFNDGSGSLDVYCGDDWQQDRKEFLYGKKFHRKMDNKSRIVLHYDKSYGDRFTATTDCSRGYYPEASRNEPEHYSLYEIEDKLLLGLEDLLLKIRNTPTQEVDKNLFTQPDPTYLTNTIFTGTVFHTQITRDNLDRIEEKLYGNYGMNGGWRLLPMSVQGPKEHKYYDLMNNGFIYCDIEWPNGQVDKNNWHYNWNKDMSVGLKLNSVDNVFVVDAAAADDFRNQWFKNHEGVEYMTNEAANEMQIERAKTMVHINEYTGNFKKPVILIGRIVSSEEILIEKEK